jgi:hypothetical protein
MNTSSLHISLKSFFLLGLIEHLALVNLSLIIAWLLYPRTFGSILTISIVFVLGNFIVAPAMWMIARGSNWANTPVALKVTLVLPLFQHTFFAGGLLGSYLLGSQPWIGFIVLFLLVIVSRFAGYWLGDRLVEQLRTGNPLFSFLLQ